VANFGRRSEAVLPKLTNFAKQFDVSNVCGDSGKKDSVHDITGLEAMTRCLWKEVEFAEEGFGEKGSEYDKTETQHAERVYCNYENKCADEQDRKPAGTVDLNIEKGELDRKVRKMPGTQIGSVLRKWAATTIWRTRVERTTTGEGEGGCMRQNG
jgi:hypothetical protein